MTKVVCISLPTASGLAPVKRMCEFKYKVGKKTTLLSVTTPLVGRKNRIQNPFTLTHVVSGRAIAAITNEELAKYCDGKTIDYVGLGKNAMRQVIDRVGVSRFVKAIEEYNE